MLRRRILASSMASVMALTSVVGVAFAADTDVDTKAGLEKYIKDFDKFLDDGINDYGEVAANQFLDAIDHAKTVIDDKNAKAADYAAAYAMVQTMRDKMVPHDATELAGLIKDCKPDYDSDNILNEKLEDNIYDEEVFGEFQVAYEDAEYYVDSEDGRLITESYMNLDAAFTKLKNSKLETVTKAQFRAALRDYDDVIRKQHDYESWRRGTCSVKPTTSTKGDDDKTVGDITDTTKFPYITYGQLFDIIYGKSDGEKIDASNENYTALPTVGSSNKALYIGWKTGTTVTSATTLAEFVRAAYDTFVEIKESNETSDVDIVTAYDAAIDAVKVFNGWKKDNVNAGSDASVRGILKDYHDRLVLNFNETDALNVVNGLKADNATDLGSGELTLDNAKAGQKGWLKLDTSKNVIGTYWISDSFDNNADVKTDAEIVGAQVLAKGAKVLQYVDVDNDDLTTNKSGVKNAKATGINDEEALIEAAAGAMKAAELYLKEKAKPAGCDYETNCYGSDTGDIETLNEFAPEDYEASGSSAEWTLVYRSLRYAMDDLYDDITKEVTHKKTDVEKLLDEAYEWIEKTGDVDVFKAEQQALVDAREAALEWLRESDKMKKDYKDGKKVNKYEAKYGVKGSTTTYINGQTSGTDVEVDATTAYNFLDTYLDALKDKYAAYEISYSEIKDLIGNVEADIVGGGVTGTDELKKALADCAEALSVLEATNIDNEAFDDDRVFNEYNRLLTAQDGSDKPNASEKALKTAYEALQKEYDAAKKGESLEPNVNGDTVVDTNDVAELMKLVLSNKADVSKHDFNGDKVVDVLDAKQLLTDILAGKYNA